MTENVPLVVPEVNENDLKEHNGIIANPNCSTIQMVVALEPVRQQYGLKRVIVSHIKLYQVLVRQLLKNCMNNHKQS